MKLTDDAVIEIRKRRAAGESLEVLACDYKVSKSTISLIATGKRRSNVDGPLTSNKRITKNHRHKQIFEAITTYWKNMGFSPSIRDLVLLTDSSSTSVVNYHLSKLEQLGYIERTPGIARSIVIKRERI